MAAMAAEPEEELAHAEVLELFQAALARLVQDPLLCDLPPQVTPEEIGSQVALEYGQAMTVRVCKADGETVPVVVVQNASVLELKKALRRHVQLRQARQGGVQHLSWKYIWRTYHLTYAGEKLADDRKKLREFARPRGLLQQREALGKFTNHDCPVLSMSIHKPHLGPVYHPLGVHTKTKAEWVMLAQFTPYGIRNRDEVSFIKKLRK